MLRRFQRLKTFFEIVLAVCMRNLFVINNGISNIFNFNIKLLFSVNACTLDGGQMRERITEIPKLKRQI